MNMNHKMLTLYAKALTHKPFVSMQQDASGSAVLMPDIACERKISIHPQHCDAYNALTKWQPALATFVHPNYVQTLSLPLQLEMMVNKYFPFSPMGMVHVANQISVNRLPSQSEQLHLRTYFGNIYFHKKGWLFEVITTANSESVLSSARAEVKATSFYLARVKHTDTNRASQIEDKQAPNWIVKASENTNVCIDAGSDIITNDALSDSASTIENLNFAPNIGRKYAKISGDYNPIHLHAICAKFFGFKKAIAHGMFSKALMVSLLANTYRFCQGEFEIDTVFKQAIALPGQAILKSQLSEPNTVDFALRPKLVGKEKCFLQGTIRY